MKTMKKNKNKWHTKGNQKNNVLLGNPLGYERGLNKHPKSLKNPVFVFFHLFLFVFIGFHWFLGFSFGFYWFSIYFVVFLWLLLVCIVCCVP